MRDFILSDITGGNKAPFSKRSLEHVNEMTSELGDYLIKSIGDKNTISDLVIMQGCDITGSQPGVISYTAGFVYYGGDIFKVDANASLTINIGEVATWVYDDSYISGDPATFSDTNTYNFHRIRKMKMISGVSGSGLVDYDGVKMFHKYQSGTIFDTAIGNTANITGITNQARLVRNGNNVYIASEIEVTLSVATEEINISLPFLTTAPDNYPLQNSLVYPASGRGYGSVANKLGVSMPLCSGYVIVDSVNNQLDVKWTCKSAETTHKVLMNVFYVANAPYSPY